MMLDVARRTAEECFIPYTVGGGMRSAEDIRAMLAAGADKISLNSAAVRDPKLVTHTSRHLRQPVHRRRRRREGGRRAAATAGRSSSTAGASTPASTPSSGCARSSGSARARSCSRAWTATARTSATTSRSRAPSRARSTSPSSPPAARASSSTSRRSSSRRTPTRCSPRSTLHYGKFTVRQVKEHMARHGIPVRMMSDGARRMDPRLKYDDDGLIPAIVQQHDTRRGADARVDGRGGGAPDVRDRHDVVLEPLAAGVLEQGRDLGHTSGGASTSATTATPTRCSCSSTRAGRRLPHRRAHVLLPHVVPGEALDAERVTGVDAVLVGEQRRTWKTRADRWRARTADGAESAACSTSCSP